MLIVFVHCSSNGTNIQFLLYFFLCIHTIEEFNFITSFIKADLYEFNDSGLYISVG